MTRSRLLSASLVALVGLSACAGFREAMTAHVNVVARAGSQELTVERLAELIGESEAPLETDVARSLAQYWVNYQLLGQAAAHGDSLWSDQDADAGMWNQVAQRRLGQLFGKLQATWTIADPSEYERMYGEGIMLAAAHILLTKQPEGISATANDSIRREADKIAATVTAKTFAAVAKARSQDPGSKDLGGDYGVFPRGQMVKEFDEGILSVPPGGISKVVETQFGYHIIRRHTWEEIRDKFAQAYGGIATQRSESLYYDGLESSANVKVKNSAGKLLKSIAADVNEHRDDRSVMASSRRGNLTAARMSQYIASFPPQSKIPQQILQTPDSELVLIVRNIMRGELLLKAADSAEVVLDSGTIGELRDAFRRGTMGIMTALDLTPGSLAAAAPDPVDRERIAATRVDEYFRSLLRTERDFVQIAEPVALVLRSRYESRIVPAAIDRVVAEAKKVRSVADSTRAANQPPSAVPMPGGPPSGAPPGAPTRR